MQVIDITGSESVLARLLAKAVPDGDCLIFTGALGSNGYGRIWDGEKPDGAHRVSWRVHFGPIPPRMFVCHRCDRPACIAPAHLFLGTCRDNLADMRAKRRHSHGPEHGTRLREVWTPEARKAQGQRLAAAARWRREARAAAFAVAWSTGRSRPAAGALQSPAEHLS